MSVKTLKTRFQIGNCGVTPEQVLVTILANGTEVFSGYLAKTLDSFPQFIPSGLTPYSEAVFDLDVPDLVSNENNSISIPMEITCTGGDICLQGIYSNYSVRYEVDPNDPTKNITVLGDANTFVCYDIDTQPLINGALDRNRYILSDNFGKTGPGCIVVFQGEVLTFGAYIQKFSSTL
jgi:hypothetical protein